jgi:hypothetical protein
MIFANTIFADIDKQVILNAYESSVSVRVSSPFKGVSQYGTGILITKDSQNMVLTCAHIFKKDMVYEIADIKFIKDIFVYRHKVDSNGTKIGEENWKADLIYFDLIRDVAVLKLRNCNISTTTKFDSRILPVGTPLFHISCFLLHHNVFMTCNMSSPNMVPNTSVNTHNLFYDQIDLLCVGGSSGGGVFNKDGKCIGIIVMAFCNSRCSALIPFRYIESSMATVCMDWIVNDKDAPDSKCIDKYIEDIRNKIYDAEK